MWVILSIFPPRPSVYLPQSVTISGLDVAVGLDQRLPLLHHRPQLVGGQPHPVEVGQAVLALLDKPIWGFATEITTSVRRAEFCQPDVQISWIRCITKWTKLSSFNRKPSKLLSIPSLPELLHRRAWTSWTTSRHRSRSGGQQEKPATFGCKAVLPFPHNPIQFSKILQNKTRTSYTRPFSPSEAILVPWVLKS